MYKNDPIWRPLVAVCCLFLLSATAKAELPTTGAVQNNAEKIGKLLSDSGYTVRKTGTNTWLIERQSKELGNFIVLIAAGPDFMVTGVIVATRKNIPANVEMMRKLLKLNHSFDYLKVGFDDDDDLFVRSEVSSAHLDLTVVKAEVERVSAGADKVYQEVKPYLRP